MISTNKLGENMKNNINIKIQVFYTVLTDKSRRTDTEYVKGFSWLFCGEL